MINFDITEIDKNQKIESSLPVEDIELHNYLSGEFTISGAYEYDKSGSCLSRLPLKLLPKISEEFDNKVIANLCHCPAGVRIRFRTNSSYIAIKSNTSHGESNGYMNYDLYRREGDSYRHIRSLSSLGNKGNFETYATTDSSKVFDYEIYFPILSAICGLFIGLKKGSVIEKPSSYLHEKPIVFYGSSITHGASSVRPGNTYTAMISRQLCSDYINLGFSGSAKGEKVLAEYIATIDMSAFVLDYDHNAPTAEHLKNTHERFYKIIREKNPDLPIIVVSRPNTPYNTLDDCERRYVIFTTYKNARLNGDNNIYFIDGDCFAKNEFGDTMLTDACHPSEVGFEYMAKTIGGVLKSVLPL